MMLATAITFKDVFPRYCRNDKGFLWEVSPEEWEKVEEVNHLLAVFNDVTNIVSGSDYPTSNLFLSEVWGMKEVLHKKSMDKNEYMRSMAAKMLEKFDKYWGESNLLMSIAAVLDPRYKMKLINFCFPYIYPADQLSKHIDNVLSTLHELYELYVADHNSSVLQSAQETSGSSSVSSRGPLHKVPTGRLRYLEHVRSSDIIRPLKTDLDIYLEEDVYICEKDDNGEDIDSNFEALAWWKFNALKYRILSKMARDILAVPMTSVASESAFSAGGRVIEPHRASLATETVQMLLCGSDWVRAIHGIKKQSILPVSGFYYVNF
jgi:hypothetical protein